MDKLESMKSPILRIRPRAYLNDEYNTRLRFSRKGKYAFDPRTGEIWGLFGVAFNGDFLFKRVSDRDDEVRLRDYL